MTTELNTPDVSPRLDPQVELNIVEIYPYIEYIKYLLAGSTAMGIFITAMIGGGITYIDDKMRGLHEGYLLTPITKMELIGGLIGAGTLKAFMAGMCLIIIGGLIAGIQAALGSGAADLSGAGDFVRVGGDDQLDVFGDGARGRSAGAARDFRRAEHAALFPSGAVYPTEAFPPWLRWISVIDPFTYTVHALRNLTVKNTGIAGIYKDVLFWVGFSAIMISCCVGLFKRQL